jgi:broad specificity phosphatase PhoE
VGVLLLLRHGQGSMGTSDYDQLSELGHRQARALGARLARADLSVGQVWSGGLARQRETARAVLAELGRPPSDLRTDIGLDEYDPLGVLGADTAGDPFTAATTPESRRALQVRLDEALARWIQGGAGYPEPHGAFTARVEASVTDLAATPGTTLAITSGRGDRGGLRPAHRPARRPVAGAGPGGREREHHQAHHRPDRDPPADLQRSCAPGR